MSQSELEDLIASRIALIAIQSSEEVA